MTDTITLRRPDDFHLHLRDGAILEAVARGSLDFARAIIMPNLVPPVVDAAMVRSYRDRIMTAVEKSVPGAEFGPLMTLYLTDDTTPATIDEVAGLCTAAKLYPAHATTNSASGVNDIDGLTPVLERMAERGIVLCIHGEVTDHEVDIFDREAVFLERVLAPMRERVPELKIVLEHVSTRTAIDFVKAAGNMGATITAHHLVIDRNDLLAGGIRPHNYCLPIVKRREDREALVAAATGDNPAFFFGSDSAPHTDPRKLGPCGAAGCFTAPLALAILAHLFEAAGALDRLEEFVSLRGAAFYGLPPNPGTVTLTRGAPVPLDPIDTADGPITLFNPGFEVTWRVENSPALDVQEKVF
ncbi:dihydroorotase [Acuticoccus sediminis]|uniref:Dihydroorotase n=1 Tax=Acuticoccus sediminis TaxID=2184697 RepID=A0A8B2P1K4_9HYPH|nr:dihydroorotase [Acuticoccus sediminis]RAI03012.1 dihydroorotase [Acuticoccus sediminis]